MPQITESTPRAEIKIQDIVFACPRPYAEGHVLTAGEATALNQTFAENIRNNTAALVKARNDLQERADKGEDINGSQIRSDEELIDEFEKYARQYEFGIRSVRGVSEGRLNPVEREARKIATQQIKDALRERNITLKSVSDEKMEELVNKLATSEKVVALARKRVEETKSISLEELNLSALTETPAQAAE
jgi:hypothetical protein